MTSIERAETDTMNMQSEWQHCLGNFIINHTDFNLSPLIALIPHTIHHFPLLKKFKMLFYLNYQRWWQSNDGGNRLQSTFEMQPNTYTHINSIYEACDLKHMLCVASACIRLINNWDCVRRQPLKYNLINNDQYQ